MGNGARYRRKKVGRNRTRCLTHTGGLAGCERSLNPDCPSETLRCSMQVGSILNSPGSGGSWGGRVFCRGGSRGCSLGGWPQMRNWGPRRDHSTKQPLHCLAPCPSSPQAMNTFIPCGGDYPLRASSLEGGDVNQTLAEKGDGGGRASSIRTAGLGDACGVSGGLLSHTQLSPCLLWGAAFHPSLDRNVPVASQPALQAVSR